MRSTEAVIRGKGSLKVVFCFRAREEHEELVLGGEIKLRRFADRLPALLAGVACLVRISKR